MTKQAITIGEHKILPGETKDIHYKISENYLGRPIVIPVRVVCSKKEGPTLFLTGGVHGDEMNSIAVVRDAMALTHTLIKGSVIYIPVVNVFGFQENSRYLPDRRDLNRCFPGRSTGSLGDRLAHSLYQDIIQQCDYGIDCHTGAFPRTNYPQIRADMTDPKVKEMAILFNAPMILDSKGDTKTLRSVASRSGCPTIVYEAGEVNKFEKVKIRTGIKGIENVMKGLGFFEGEPEPGDTISVTQSHWVRSNYGGLLRLKVKPGDRVKKGQVIALCQSMFDTQSKEITTPYKGIVIGLTLMPAIQPGEPVCHIGMRGSNVLSD